VTVDVELELKLELELAVVVEEERTETARTNERGEIDAWGLSAGFGTGDCIPRGSVAKDG
jgi:hypothetical protein